MAEICNAAQGNGGSAPWRWLGGRGRRRERERGGEGRGGRRQNAEIGMYPAGYSTMERIDSLFNYVFREVTSTATPTFQPPSTHPPLQPSSPHLFSIAVYPYESFNAPLWNLDSELVSGLFILATLAWLKLVEIPTNFSWNGVPG